MIKNEKYRALESILRNKVFKLSLDECVNRPKITEFKINDFRNLGGDDSTHCSYEDITCRVTDIYTWYGQKITNVYDVKYNGIEFSILPIESLCKKEDIRNEFIRGGGVMKVRMVLIAEGIFIEKICTEVEAIKFERDMPAKHDLLFSGKPYVIGKTVILNGEL